jgi:hypothetical protein
MITDAYKNLGLLVDNKHVFQRSCSSTTHKRSKETLLYQNYEQCTCWLTAFFGMLPQYAVKYLDRPRKICSKIVKQPELLSSNENVYDRHVRQLAMKIQKDHMHPLQKQYALLPGRRRLRVPCACTKRFRNTFVYKSIKCWMTAQVMCNKFHVYEQ